MPMTAAFRKKLFFAMLRIRMVQERIESLYLQDRMQTPIHLCIGQEAIAVGVCAALREKDYISSNHRSHGHYLAKGGSLKALLAELHGRSDGCSRGYGGSMHLVAPSVGHLGSSAIVGGGIPIGTGLGLAIKLRQRPQVSVIFFGDGAADEGVLYESINFAILKQLPVVYVLENNKWSVCSRVTARQAADNIFHRTPPHLLFSRQLNGNDVLEVYTAARQAVERARRGAGPSFLECDTYRILGHAGCAAQDPKGYRDLQEVAEWQEKCPIKTFREELGRENILSPQEIADMEKQLTAEINAAFAFAEASPFPAENALQANLFSG